MQKYLGRFVRLEPAREKTIPMTADALYANFIDSIANFKKTIMLICYYSLFILLWVIN